MALVVSWVLWKYQFLLRNDLFLTNAREVLEDIATRNIDVIKNASDNLFPCIQELSWTFVTSVCAHAYELTYLLYVIVNYNMSLE